MKVVMKDIAKALEISVVSVSKSLNDQEGVSENLREIVKKKALEMGYKGAVLKNAKPDQTDTMGVIIPERFILRKNRNQGFYLDFFQLICAYNQEKGISTILYILTKEEENRLSLPTIILENKVDSVIFMAELKSTYLIYVKDNPIPKVFLDFFGKNIRIDCVTTDNYSGSYDVTSELINKGHQEIGFVGNISATTSIQDRFLGFQKALYENKIHFNPTYLVEDRDDTGMFIDVVLPDRLPTAFVCNSDRSAYELVKKLTLNGISVPNDVSVVGFDNDIYSRFSDPQITTVEVSKDHMVKNACDFLYSKIEDPKATLGKITIKGNLIRRDSVKDIR